MRWDLWIVSGIDGWGWVEVIGRCAVGCSCCSGIAGWRRTHPDQGCVAGIGAGAVVAGALGSHRSNRSDLEDLRHRMNRIVRLAGRVGSRLVEVGRTSPVAVVDQSLVEDNHFDDVAVVVGIGCSFVDRSHLDCNCCCFRRSRSPGYRMDQTLCDVEWRCDVNAVESSRG